MVSNYLTELQIYAVRDDEYYGHLPSIGLPSDEVAKERQCLIW